MKSAEIFVKFLKIKTTSLVLILTLFCSSLNAGTISYQAISGDADSGIYSGNTFTHAVDFGNNSSANISGVVFQDGQFTVGYLTYFESITGTSATVGSGTLTSSTEVDGPGSVATYLVNGASSNIYSLLRDMVYNDTTLTIRLTGLNASGNYRFRLYNRQWGDVDHDQTIGFDTNSNAVEGQGMSISDAEDTATFDQQRATELGPNFGTDTQVYSINYDYVLSGNTTTLTIFINGSSASYYMYGFTNEKLTDAPNIITESLIPLDNRDSGVGLSSDFVIRFDENVQKGTGNILLYTLASNTLIESFDVATGNVSVNGSNVSINPSSSLMVDTSYYIQIEPGAIKDNGSVSFPGISDNTTWNFTTSAINFAAITGDSDSGFSSSKTYTHLVDFGDSTVASINGVAFQNAYKDQFAAPDNYAFSPISGTSATVGTGEFLSPTAKAAHAGALGTILVNGASSDTYNLMYDMVYNDTILVVTLTGLTSGANYQFKLFNRSWQNSYYEYDIGFDTDGVGSDITGSEHRTTFYGHLAHLPQPSVDIATRVYATTYDYTLATGTNTLTIYIDAASTSYYMYGLSNEKIDGAPYVVSYYPIDNTVSGINVATNFTLNFDEDMEKGSGNIVLYNSSNSIIETIDVSSSAITISGKSVTINPSSLLAGDTGFYIKIDTGALKNSNGDVYAGISDSTTWNFSTSNINFVAISGDSDSGLSTSKNYTHLLDFGNSTVATVNGVVFQQGYNIYGTSFGLIDGTSATVGTGVHSSVTHTGTPAALGTVLENGASSDMYNLMYDMVYDDSTLVVTLTGLTSGANYHFRLYNRQWSNIFTDQVLGFDTDGVGSDINGAEHTANFDSNQAASPDPSFSTETQVYAITYDYTLAAGVTTLTMYIDAASTSFYMYGLSNYKVDGPPNIVSYSPSDNTTIRSGYSSDLVLKFDERIQSGSGALSIKKVSDDSVVESFTAGSSKISISNNMLTINPSNGLGIDSDYYVEIDAGFIKNENNENFAGLSGNSAWNFSTNIISYFPINGDTDCQISSSKIYTHAVDFGPGSPTAVINGVTFQTGTSGTFGSIAGTSATVGTGTTSATTFSATSNSADVYLNTTASANIEDLMKDMAYNDATLLITIDGLTPETYYTFRLYQRSWTTSSIQQIGFDTDGVGTDITTAEETASFDKEDPTNAPTFYPTKTQVFALSYDYKLAAGVTTLRVYINGSMYNYGLTNEKIVVPGTIIKLR